MTRDSDEHDDLHIMVERNNDSILKFSERFHASIIKGHDGLWFWHIAESYDGEQPIKKGFATRDEAVIDAVNRMAGNLRAS